MQKHPPSTPQKQKRENLLHPPHSQLRPTSCCPRTRRRCSRPSPAAPPWTKSGSGPSTPTCVPARLAKTTGANARVIPRTKVPKSSWMHWSSRCLSAAAWCHHRQRVHGAACGACAGGDTGGACGVGGACAPAGASCWRSRRRPLRRRRRRQSRIRRRVASQSLGSLREAKQWQGEILQR